MTNTNVQPPQTLEEQLVVLRQIVRQNRIDAWDLGFQGQLSPGAIDEALKQYLDRFGFAQTKKMITPMKKT
jgi:hypothetical protein